MRNRGMLRRALIAMTAGSLVVAACGGDDDDDATAESAAPEAVQDTDAPTTAGDGGDTTPATDGGSDTTPTSGGGDTPATTAGGSDSGSDSGTNSDDVCTEDRIGGELSVGVGNYPTGLDPLVALGTGAQGNMVPVAIFDTLIRYDQETGEFIPTLAESLEPNDDFTEWTLKLRPEAVFGNGDPLTAESVKTSFARHQAEGSRSAVRLETLAVTEMEVVDPLTLVFHLDGPWARFPALLAHTPGMVTNQAVIDEVGVEAFASDPAGGGAGPYELERFAVGEEIVLTAKDDWWGGPVCIQQIRFTRIPGSDATYEALEVGELDLAYSRDATVTLEGEQAGYVVYDTYLSMASTLLLNNQAGPATDLVVRQALAAAIDPEVIDERVFDGVGIPSSALVSPFSVHYQGLEGPQPDPAKAIELVEQAKANGWDGNIEFLCINAPEFMDVCLTAQAMMEAAGITVTVETGDTAEVIARVLGQRDYEMVTFGGTLSDDELLLRLSPILSSEGTLNASGYQSAEWDAALDELRAAPDEEAYKAALAELQEIFNRDIPILIYASNNETWITVEQVKGLIVMQNANPYFAYAYLEE